MDLKLFNELYEAVEKKGYSVSSVSGSDGSSMAQLIVNVDDETMIGLTINPVLSLKPFKLFPFGKDVTIQEIVEMLP